MGKGEGGEADGLIRLLILTRVVKAVACRESGVACREPGVLHAYLGVTSDKVVLSPFENRVG